jgi:hypothetical protein
MSSQQMKRSADQLIIKEVGIFNLVKCKQG